MTKDLVIYGCTYQVTNNDLIKEVNAMVKAFNGLQKNTWQYAFACYNVISKKLYEDDFKTIEKLAEALGTSKSVMSKYYNGVACYLEVFKDNYTTEQLSVSTCYLLSTLQEDIYNFLSWLPKETKIEMLRQKQLEELIKKFKGLMDETNATETTEETETETKETETDNLNYVEAIIDNEYLNVKINSKIYSIPLEELKDYEIKEA